ncbi:MAG: hypothetical protein R2753_10660 [Chitinophagales bacterium]
MRKIKTGLTNANNFDSPKPYNTLSARYAKAFANNKLAIKANISYLRVTGLESRRLYACKTIIEEPNNTKPSGRFI